MTSDFPATQPKLLQVLPICVTLPPAGEVIRLQALVSDLCNHDLAAGPHGSPTLNITFNGRCLLQEDVTISPAASQHQIGVPVQATAAPIVGTPLATTVDSAPPTVIQIIIHPAACIGLTSGCLILELHTGGGSATQTLPVLLVREADVASEVLQLQQEAGSVDRLLLDLGSWVASTAASAVTSTQQQAPPSTHSSNAAQPNGASSTPSAAAAAAAAPGGTPATPSPLTDLSPGSQQQETQRSIRLGLRLLAYRMSSLLPVSPRRRRLRCWPPPKPARLPASPLSENTHGERMCGNGTGPRVGDHTPARTHTDTRSRRCLPFSPLCFPRRSCSRGWPQTSNHLVSGLTTLGLDLAGVDAGVRGVHGLGLLHTCLQSQSAELVWLLHAWALLHHHTWDLKCAGPHGLTPLHIAAVLPAGAPAAVQLLSIFPSSCALWFSARDDNGCTPARYAQLAVNEHLNQHAIAVLAMDAALVDVQRPNDLFLGSSLNGTTMEDGRCEGTEDSFTDEAYARAIAAATTTVPASLLASGFSMGTGTGASSSWRYGPGPGDRDAQASQPPGSRRAPTAASVDTGPGAGGVGGQEAAPAGGALGVLGRNWQLLHPQPYADPVPQDVDGKRTWGSSLPPTDRLSPNGEGLPSQPHSDQPLGAPMLGRASSSSSREEEEVCTARTHGTPAAAHVGQDQDQPAVATPCQPADAVPPLPTSGARPAPHTQPATPPPPAGRRPGGTGSQRFPRCLLQGFLPHTLEAAYGARPASAHPLGIDVALLAMYLCILLLLRPASPQLHTASFGHSVLTWTASSPLFPWLSSLPLLGPWLSTLKAVELQGAAYDPPGSPLASSVVDPQSVTSLLLFVQRLPHIVILVAALVAGRGGGGGASSSSSSSSSSSRGWVGLVLRREVLLSLAVWVQTAMVMGVLVSQPFPLSSAWAGLGYPMGVQQPVLSMLLCLVVAAGQQVRLPACLAISAASVLRQVMLLVASGHGVSLLPLCFLALQQVLVVGISSCVDMRSRLSFLSRATN
ncbi:MAG: hypothetical protein WDW38_008673 [Sanguina aurantia]